MSSAAEVIVYTTLQGLHNHRLSSYELHALCASPDGSPGAHYSYSAYHPPSLKAGTQTYELTMRQQCRQWSITRSPDDLCFYYRPQGNMPECIITCQTEWITLWAQLSKKKSAYDTSVGAQYFTIAPRPVLPEVYDVESRNRRSPPSNVRADSEPSHQSSAEASSPCIARPQRDTAPSVEHNEGLAARRPHLDLTVIETAVIPMIAQVTSSITSIVTEVLTSLVKHMEEAATSAPPTMQGACLAHDSTEAGQSFEPTHCGCRPVTSAYGSSPTTSRSVNEPSAGCINAVAPGAALASSLLTGLGTASSRLGAGEAAASIMASFFDSLKRELRNPLGGFQSHFQTDAEANENTPPAEPLRRDTSGRVVSEPAFEQGRTTDVFPTYFAASASSTSETEDNARGEQLSLSTSRSRSASDGHSASESGRCLCKSYDANFAQLESKAGSEETCHSTLASRAMPTESVDAAKRVDSGEATLIEAFTEMLRERREARNGK